MSTTSSPTVISPAYSGTVEPNLEFLERRFKECEEFLIKSSGKYEPGECEGMCIEFCTLNDLLNDVDP